MMNLVITIGLVLVGMILPVKSAICPADECFDDAPGSIPTIITSPGYPGYKNYESYTWYIGMPIGKILLNNEEENKLGMEDSGEYEDFPQVRETELQLIENSNDFIFLFE